MRIIRYQYKNETPKYGWIFEENVGEIDGNIFGEYRRQEARIPLADARLLARTRAQPARSRLDLSVFRSSARF